MSQRVLLLNANFKAMDVISWQKSMVQILTESKDGAYVVEYYYDWSIMDSAGRQHKVPSIVALKEYVSEADLRAPYSKSNVLARDRNICQYCGRKFRRGELTIDHVIPKSKWEQLKPSKHAKVSSFENTVACCKRCNLIKGDKLCKECKMWPLKKPGFITQQQAFENKLGLMEGHIPIQWKPYIKEKI